MMHIANRRIRAQRFMYSFHKNDSQLNYNYRRNQFFSSIFPSSVWDDVKRSQSTAFSGKYWRHEEWDVVSNKTCHEVTLRTFQRSHTSKSESNSEVDNRNDGVKVLNFDPNKSEDEYYKTMAQLLTKPLGTMDTSDIDTSEETISFLINKARTSLDEIHKNREKDLKPLIVSAADSIQKGLTLFTRITKDIQSNSSLASKLSTIYWYSGSTPRATHLFNPLLDCWRILHSEALHCRSLDAFERMQIASPTTMLKNMESLSTKPDLESSLNNLVPSFDNRSYTLIMQARLDVTDSLWSAPIFCEDILWTYMINDTGKQSRIESHNESKPSNEIDSGIWNNSTKTVSSCSPDAATITLVLKSWKLSKRDDTYENVQRFFNTYLRLYNANHIPQAKPSTLVYNTYIQGLLSFPTIERAQQAEVILREMQMSGDPDILPDEHSYRQVILGFLNIFHNKSFYRNSKYDAKTVDEMKAQYIDHAFQILLEGIQKCPPTNTDWIENTFGKLISTLAIDRYIRVNPTEQGRSDSTNRMSFQKAEELYLHMKELYERTHDERFQPGVLTNKAMLMLYNNTNRPELAERLLDAMEMNAKNHGYTPGLLPSNSHYKDLQGAWERSGSPEQVRKGLLVMLRSVHVAFLSKDYSLVPNRSRFIHIFSETSNCYFNLPNELDVTLHVLLHYYDRHGNHEIKPLFVYYLGVMKSWYYSANEVSDTSKKIISLIQDMNKRSQFDAELKPSKRMYALAIQAAALEKQPGYIDVCMKLYDEAQKNCDDATDQHGNRDRNPLYSAMMRVAESTADAKSAIRFLVSIINEFESGIATAKPSRPLFDKVLMCCLRSESKVDHEKHIVKLHSMMVKYLAPRGIQSKTYGLMLEILNEQQRCSPSDSLRQMISDFDKKKIQSLKAERSQSSRSASSFNSRH